MKLPTVLNTSRLYDQQEAVIDGASPSTLSKYRLLVWLLERWLFGGPSNLTIRFHVLTGNVGKAWRQFQALVSDGIYVEGASYWPAIRRAIDRIPAGGGFESAILRGFERQINSNFKDIGNCFPETRAEDMTPSTAQAVSTPTRTLWLSSDGKSWMLILHDVNLLKFKRNGHVNPCFGAFMYVQNGAVVKGWQAYTGFQNKPSDLVAYCNGITGWWWLCWRWLWLPRGFKVTYRTDTCVELKLGIWPLSMRRIIECGVTGVMLQDKRDFRKVKATFYSW